MSHSTNGIFLRIRQSGYSDLVIGTLLVCIIDFVVLTMTPGVLIASFLALPLLLFLPGYFVLAALFPARASYGRWIGRFSRIEGIDWYERMALAYGLSIVLLPFVALALTVTAIGLTSETVLASLTGIILVMVPLAAIRRSGLPANRRFQFINGEWTDAIREGARTTDRRDFLVNGILAVAVLSAAATASVAVLSPPQSESYTDLAVLTQNDHGKLVAKGYPSTVKEGQPIPLVLVVQNHADQTKSYTVVVQLQKVADDGTVTSTSRLKQFSTSVGPGSTWKKSHDVRIPVAGQRLRVTYLLYEGNVPKEPTRDNAKQSVHFWVNSTR